MLNTDTDYRIELCGDSFVCLEKPDGSRMWWDLLLAHDEPEPAFVKTHPHTPLSRKVMESVMRFLNAAKRLQREPKSCGQELDYFKFKAC